MLEEICFAALNVSDWQTEHVLCIMCLCTQVALGTPRLIWLPSSTGCTKKRRTGSSM